MPKHFGPPTLHFESQYSSMVLEGWLALGFDHDEVLSVEPLEDDSGAEVHQT